MAKEGEGKEGLSKRHLLAAGAGAVVAGVAAFFTGVQQGRREGYMRGAEVKEREQALRDNLSVALEGGEKKDFILREGIFFSSEQSWDVFERISKTQGRNSAFGSVSSYLTIDRGGDGRITRLVYNHGDPVRRISANEAIRVLNVSRIPNCIALEISSDDFQSGHRIYMWLRSTEDRPEQHVFTYDRHGMFQAYKLGGWSRGELFDLEDKK